MSLFSLSQSYNATKSVHSSPATCLLILEAVVNGYTVILFNPFYLVGVRILSVASASHLFHRIKRQSQAGEQQQADSERRHHACDRDGRLPCVLRDSSRL